ncbi:MAG TPA: HAMP domain-containing sensor histidine kinase [Haliangium sp.]|nr:HAMP domain-containing sensor histidine kinase [Haliangium sp.]
MTRGAKVMVAVTSHTRFARLARWSLSLAAVLMGIALLATVWSTNRGVRDASEVLLRGQLVLIHDSVRARLRPLDQDATGAELEAIVTELEPDGLRWLAFLERDGTVRAQGGRPAAEAPAVALLSARPGVPVEVGERVRAVFRRPGRRGGEQARDRDRRGKPELHPLVIEFEPTATHALRAAARRTLGLGALAAGALLAVALGLVRWFLRRERLERQLEQERRLAGLGRMSAVLAHEIRNPLASLKGNAQLLVRALPEGERTRAKAELLVDEAVRLETLTNDLLDFARGGELQIADTDPAALAREAVAAVEPAVEPATGARIELVTEHAPATWPLDGPRMRQVLTNLLENALQAGDGSEVGPVTATVARDGGALVFEVRDRGPGIQDQDLPRVFEPFFTRRVRGTGLGLAICKRLVELHGGAITAANADDGGAVFTVRISRSN